MSSPRRRRKYPQRRRFLPYHKCSLAHEKRRGVRPDTPQSIGTPVSRYNVTSDTITFCYCILVGLTASLTQRKDAEATGVRYLEASVHTQTINKGEGNGRGGRGHTLNCFGFLFFFRSVLQVCIFHFPCFFFIFFHKARLRRSGGKGGGPSSPPPLPSSVIPRTRLTHDTNMRRYSASPYVFLYFFMEL